MHIQDKDLLVQYDCEPCCVLDDMQLDLDFIRACSQGNSPQDDVSPNPDALF